MPSPILILDGGLGTALEDAYGFTFSAQRTPLWSSHLLVTDQETLLACQSDFGGTVDVIETATYQISEQGFTRTITEDWPAGVDRSHIGPFIEGSIRIAEAARSGNPNCSLALALGPYGACTIPSQEYSGDYGEYNGVVPLVKWHRERLKLFTSIEGLLGQVGYIAFETVPRIEEVVAFREVLADAKSEYTGNSTWPLLWISCLFPGDGETLPDGSTVEQVVEAMLKPDAAGVVPWGIGINCTKVDKISRLVSLYEAGVKRMADEGHISSWPSLVLYPDGTSGEVYDTTTQQWKMPTKNSSSRVPWEIQLADIVKVAAEGNRWRSILVGGCCKAKAHHIKALRTILKPPA